MVEIIICWAYIALVCSIVGAGINHLAQKNKNIPSFKNMTVVQCVITGVVTLTIYAEFFSIFYKVGIICHVIMLVAALICGYFAKDFLVKMCRKLWQTVKSWEGIFYFLIILVTAYYTSRGQFHTDTGIYHAQAIRIIEEYGLIKGLANLQLHFGYNSAYFSFCALFTGSSMLPSALHATTGFIEAVCLIYAFRNIKNYLRSSKIVVCSSIAIIVYAIVNITGSMSPATDYVTLFMVLYVITEWCIAAAGNRNCNKQDDLNSHQQDVADIDTYILPAIMSVFIVSMKLSTGPIILLVLYPLVILIKDRKWMKVLWSIILSVITVLPYLIRNVLISGWLLYPFDKIDIFNVEWKVPVEYLRTDAAQIAVWGKTLYDVTKQDMPMSQWVPIWWSNQQHYDQMLIYALILSVFFIICIMLGRLLRKERINLDVTTLYIAMFAVLILWFVESPFVRYGLEMLIAVPLITMGLFWDAVCVKSADKVHGSFEIYFGGTAVVLIVLCFAALLDHYVMDDLVFAKQYAGKSNYVMQQPFDDSETGAEELNGNKVYYSVEGQINSYYSCPSTCYKVMLDRSELMGNTIKSGFKAK